MLVTAARGLDFCDALRDAYILSVETAVAGLVFGDTFQDAHVAAWDGWRRGLLSEVVDFGAHRRPAPCAEG